MNYTGVGSECISVEDKAAVLESTVLNITQSSKQYNTYSSIV